MMQIFYGHRPEGDDNIEILETMAPIKGDDLLVFCGHVCVYLLDTMELGSGAIVSRLRPVEWRADPLHSFPSQKDMVKDLISNFSPYDQLMNSVQKANIRPKAGLAFWPKGHMKDCREFAAGACMLPLNNTSPCKEDVGGKR
jgi:hypothetical protein